MARRQRRSTFGVAEFKNDSLEKVVSMTLSKTQFILTLVVTVMTIIGATWAAASTAYGFLEKEIDVKIQRHDIESQMRMMKQFEQLNIRLLRQEILLQEVYRATTGKSLPDADSKR